MKNNLFNVSCSRCYLQDERCEPGDVELVNAPGGIDLYRLEVGTTVCPHGTLYRKYHSMYT